jgi:hypothetical protein
MQQQNSHKMHTRERNSPPQPQQNKAQQPSQTNKQTTEGLMHSFTTHNPQRQSRQASKQEHQQVFFVCRSYCPDKSQQETMDSKHTKRQTPTFKRLPRWDLHLCQKNSLFPSNLMFVKGYRSAKRTAGKKEKKRERKKRSQSRLLKAGFFERKKERKERKERKEKRMLGCPPSSCPGGSAPQTPPF